MWWADDLVRAPPPKLGLHVYGLTAVALGLMGFAWGDFATVWQPVQAGVPHRTLLAYVTAACLLVAGVAAEWRGTAPAGLTVLTILYLLFALLWWNPSTRLLLHKARDKHLVPLARPDLALHPGPRIA